MNRTCHRLVRAFNEEDYDAILDCVLKIIVECGESEYELDNDPRFQFMLVASKITTKSFWRTLKLMAEQDKQLMINQFQDFLFQELDRGGFVRTIDFFAYPSGMVAVTPKAKTYLMDHTGEFCKHFLEDVEAINQ